MAPTKIVYVRRKTKPAKVAKVMELVEGEGPRWYHQLLIVAYIIFWVIGVEILLNDASSYARWLGEYRQYVGAGILAVVVALFVLTIPAGRKKVR